MQNKSVGKAGSWKMRYDSGSGGGAPFYSFRGKVVNTGINQVCAPARFQVSETSVNVAVSIIMSIHAAVESFKTCSAVINMD